MGGNVRSLRFLDGLGITHRLVRKDKNLYVGGYDVQAACGQRWNALDQHLRRTRAVDCIACVAEETSWP